MRAHELVYNHPSMRFGVFEANPATGELWKNGIKLKLQEQPFRLLAMLLARPGALVSREELQAALWPNAEYGEFEQGLNTAIKKVRQALGDSAENPRFVETLPRKGYRFIAPVHVPEVLQSAEAAPSEPRSKPPTRWSVFLGISLLLAALAGAAYWVRPSAIEPAPQFTTPVPLTSMRGFERGPSFSPDSQQIAFSWNGETEDNFDIYVKALHSEKLTRLTQDPLNDFGAAWSPDGQRIAFGRILPNGRKGVYLVPASGGPEIKLAETVWVPDHHPFVAWSPDGKWLAITDRAAEDAAVPNAIPCLNLLSLETGELRRLTTVPPNHIGDVAPAFSRDGLSIAFIRAVFHARRTLYVLPLTREYKPDGPPVEVEINGDGRVASLGWMPDNRRLVVSKPWQYGSSANSGLWLLDSARRSQPVHIEIAPNTSTTVAVSPAGEIAYSWNQSDMNIWRVHLDSAHHPTDVSKPLIASTMDEIVPKFSPDGKQIVFISKRSGSAEVWSGLSDGTNPVQLTNMGNAGSPSWSPDGTHIVFDSTKEGQYEVYTMLATGGTPRRLTNHPAPDGAASYSHDGQYIFFMSPRAGSQQIWRMRTDGSEPTQITRQGGYLARASPDGKYLYYFKYSKPNGIWRVPVNGGEEVRLPVPSFDSFLNFTVTADSIYYFSDPAPGSEVWIERFDLASQTTQKVVNVNAGPGHRFTISPDSYIRFARAGLSLSPDGHALVWAQSDQAGSDLMLTRVR